MERGTSVIVTLIVVHILLDKINQAIDLIQLGSNVNQIMSILGSLNVDVCIIFL